MDFSTPTISTEFIACGCCKAPHTVDWSFDCNLIAFGSSCNVCLLKPEDSCKPATVISSYIAVDNDPLEEQKLTCVRFFKKASNCDADLLLTCSSSGKCSVWRVNGYNDEFLKVANFQHGFSIEFACGIYLNNKLYVASSDSDHKLIIWDGGSFECTISDLTVLNTFNLESGGFVFCADFINIEGTDDLILAVGCDDTSIKVFIRHSNQDFRQIFRIMGHDDWVRDVSFSGSTIIDTSYLASCSQDKYARIWLFEITSKIEMNADSTNDDELSLKRYTYKLDCNKTFEVSLESVLGAHDGWIYSIRWDKEACRLLTASSDKSVMVWSQNASSKTWLPSIRLGEVGDQGIGYLGAVFSPDGRCIIAHSFLGSFNGWKLNDQGEWRACTMPSGHSESVNDIAWDTTGNYVLSCSNDQTTRVFAPWKSKGTIYKELSRPQVHGHNMHCLAVIDSFRFVSGSEEKILRAFTAPTNFIRNLYKFSLLDQSIVDNYCSKYGTIEGAEVTALGLSNQAVLENDVESESKTNRDQYSSISYKKVELEEPPVENLLQHNTLWPESHKLYGHGFEISCVAANHSGTLIATACKATNAEHAGLIMWTTEDWHQKCTLSGHTLTVTQIAFSPNDKCLLSVSRDRTWQLYRKQQDDFHWSKVDGLDKSKGIHGRIIFGCAWFPDSRFFVTVSRDKRLAIWCVAEMPDNSFQGVSLVGNVYETEASPTAVAVAPIMLDESNAYVIAYGMENGRISFLRWNYTMQSFKPIPFSHTNLNHGQPIKKLKFRPFVKDHDTGLKCTLASCSADNSLRIHSIYF